MTAAARLPRTVRNPYRVPRPAVISFSGGRTSSYMLNHIVDAYDGRLPTDVAIVFANTGLERPETLEFVDACSRAWSVDIVWVLWRAHHYGSSIYGTHRTAPASSTSPPRPGTANPTRH